MNSSNRKECKTDVSINQEVRKGHKELYLNILAILLMGAFCAAAIIFKDELMSIANIAGYSLLGVFIVSFIAGGPLSATAIPVPYWLLVLTIPSVLPPHWGILAPVAVALTSALGDTLGDLPTFFIGYSGGRLSRGLSKKFDSRFSNRAIEWARRHGSLAAFVMSVLFNPVHLPMTLALGTIHFSPLKFFLFDFMGALVKCLFLAFFGYFGLGSLFNFGSGGQNLVFLLVIAVLLGIGVWQLAVWLGEIRDKHKKYEAARTYALRTGKPLLVAGGPWGAGQVRHWVNMPAHGNGDVCLDINSSAMRGCPNGVIADVTNIPFSDKSFGAAFASHLLEHLPNADEGKKALAELTRIADSVFIAYPSRQSLIGWIIPDHHLRIWQNGETTYLKQRGQSVKTC